MAFFKNFQQNLNLPSVSSLVNTLSSAVDDLTSAVGDVSYTVADSVTEQVTSMINSFRMDETATTQDDKSVVSLEENRTALNSDKDKHIAEKGCNAEEKHKQIDYLKQSTNDGRKSHHNIKKMQTQLNAVEPNNLNEPKLCKEVNNSMKHEKCKRHTGSEYLENAPSTHLKEKRKESGSFTKEVSSKKTPEKDNSYINKDQRGSSSESEDEALGKYHEALTRTQNSRPPAGDSRQQKNYIWETRQKYSPLSAEYDGYSSEASIDEG
ncbi:hypothetical protein lerEdw1_018961 [Lerista edwardsae]|nr:hypothetical protein lerEdw1_018961 [Lerista edwardsae]